MSRSGYVDEWDGDILEFGRYRGRVASAIRGKRGQALLREMLAALDDMPTKRLISGNLVAKNGEVCALGCLGQRRGIDMSDLDPNNSAQVAAAFGVAKPLVAEIAYENDEMTVCESPEQRWQSMRKWVVEHLAKGVQAG